MNGFFYVCVWLGCNNKLRVCLVVHTQLVLAHSSMENDLHARAQILAGVRRGRISFLDRWDSSGGITRDNNLTPTKGHLPDTAEDVPDGTDIVILEPGG